MSDTDAQVPLPDLNSADAPPVDDLSLAQQQHAEILSHLW